MIRRPVRYFQEPHYGPISPPQAPQQSTTIPQQLPAPMMPPSSTPSIRPSGHVKDGLVELMTIQNAQMHQVIMSNTTMSALRSFGYSGPQSGPEVCQHQACCPSSPPPPPRQAPPLGVREPRSPQQQVKNHHTATPSQQPINMASSRDVIVAFENGMTEER
eukprot:superscaffoldBa00002882_g15558